MIQEKLFTWRQREHETQSSKQLEIIFLYLVLCIYMRYFNVLLCWLAKQFFLTLLCIKQNYRKVWKKSSKINTLGNIYSYNTNSITKFFYVHFLY